jgi:hypothetical protein
MTYTQRIAGLVVAAALSTGCMHRSTVATKIYRANDVVLAPITAQLRDAYNIPSSEQFKSVSCEERRYPSISGYNIGCVIVTDKQRLFVYKDWMPARETLFVGTLLPKSTENERSYSRHFRITRDNKGYSFNRSVDRLNTLLKPDDPRYADYEERLKSKFDRGIGVLHSVLSTIETVVLNNALGDGAGTFDNAGTPSAQQKTIDDVLK